MQAAAKIEVFPNPEPLGVSIISERIMNPEPNLSNISDRSPHILFSSCHISS